MTGDARRNTPTAGRGRWTMLSGRQKRELVQLVGVGLLSAESFQIFLAVSIFTMMLTPFLIRASIPVVRWIETTRRLRRWLPDGGSGSHRARSGSRPGGSASEVGNHSVSSHYVGRFARSRATKSA